jgi:hypothetical protein
MLKAPGDAVLVERNRPRLLLLSCPCGCGEEFPINLDSRAGPAWRLYRNKRRELSLFPSVWRESGCESHYIIWRNRIYLFGQYEDAFDNQQAEETDASTDIVRRQLSKKEWVPFAVLADRLGMIPWDVLVICRRLKRVGVVEEGNGKLRGTFRLKAEK